MARWTIPTLIQALVDEGIGVDEAAMVVQDTWPKTRGDDGYLQRHERDAARSDERAASRQVGCGRPGDPGVSFRSLTSVGGVWEVMGDDGTGESRAELRGGGNRGAAGGDGVGFPGACRGDLRRAARDDPGDLSGREPQRHCR